MQEASACGMSNGITSDLTMAGGSPFVVGPTSLADAELTTGECLAARVVRMLPGGDVLLAFGLNRAIVTTSDLLQPGDRVEIEVVAGGSKPELRIVTDRTAASPPVAAGQLLAAGQPLTACVLEMPAAGEVLRELAPSRTVVPTVREIRTSGSMSGSPTGFTPRLATDTDVQRTQPDNPGRAEDLPGWSNGLPPADRAELEVGAGVPIPELLELPDEAMASPRRSAGPQPGVDDDAGPAPLSARDLPVIMRALANVAPSAVPIADAGQEFLRAASAAGLRHAVTEQVQRQLAPLDAALPPAALAVMIRTFLAQSGLFTENHIRGALKSGAGVLTAAQRHAISDVRLLLGELTTAGTAVPDAVRSFGDALLQQQLAVAERQAATGVGYITIPFTFGEERVDVAFEWDKQGRGDEKQEDGPRPTVSLGVFVHLKALGAIEARVEWRPDSLAVTFVVEREATRAIVEAALDDFSKQLSSSGSPAVTAHVRFNPDRPSIDPRPMSAPISGGIILDVTA
jgi:hypothetical protein